MSQTNFAPNTGQYGFVPAKSAGIVGEKFPSRRAVLAGLALVPAVAAISPPTRAARPSEWKEALARWRAAEAAWDDFLDGTYNPAIEELDRRAPAPPPNFTVTAKSGATQLYFYDRANPDEWTRNLSSLISEPARVLHDRWMQYDRDRNAAWQALRIDELSAEEDRLAAASTEARYKLMSTPVGNAAEMLQKIEIAWAPGCDPDLFRDELFADFRHLAGASSQT